jgi:hypothetical protein
MFYMKSTLIKLAIGSICALSLYSAANAQEVRNPVTNPIDVQTGKEILPGDETGRGDVSTPPATLPRIDPLPTGAIGDLLRAHLQAMTGVGVDANAGYQDAERTYQISLKKLREQATEVVPALIASYRRTEPESYFRRWLLVETLRELKNGTAATALADIARTPIPEERYGDDAERSSVDEEIRIRVTAVEGLSAIATTGSEAEKALLQLTSHPLIGIHRAAIRGYLAASVDATEQQRRAVTLRGLLSEDRVSLMTLEATDVKKVPHPSMPEIIDIKKPRLPEGPAPTPTK